MFFLFATFSFSLTPLIAQIEECDNLNKALLNHASKNFHFHESRNDVGIFYDFEWNDKAVKLKRNDDNYPVVRFSLFDKKNILPGTIIKSFNGVDLSKIKDDDELKKLHRSSGKIDLQLGNDKIIKLNSKFYKLNDFKLTDFILNSIHSIDTAKGILEVSIDSYITNDRKDLLNSLEKNNFQKLLDNEPHAVCSELKKELSWPITSVNFKEYKYDADVREGLKNKEKLVNSVFDLTYDEPNFRTMRTEKGIFFIRQDFKFEKFPLDTQKLIITIESGVGSLENHYLLPDKNFNFVTFLTPDKGPFINLEKYQNINYLKDWKVKDITIKSREKIDNNYYYKWSDKVINYSENVLDIEITIKRNWAHYFFKIMLPVFLILCVAWYVLWIPTRKYETRLNTSIIALLALIAYNLVFQDDIPKLEYLTDLDRYILLSYVFCCIPVFISIGSSKLGTKNQKTIIKINEFIRKWGVLAYILITFAIFKLI